jgi:sarcosine/dimethylglycine N-methyltransferase
LSPRLEAMPLYTNLDRIERGLAAMGIGPGGAIRPEQLFALDQWHYHGTEAIAAAARALRLTARSRVLDVGAGVGGPARYLAHTVGCQVTALELQPQLHAIGVDLTRRTGLADRVTHVCADALTHSFADASFDAAVSFLAIVHISDRPRLFAQLARLLSPGGGCYVEDLCKRAPFAASDLADLRDVVCATAISSQDDYARDVRAAGFSDVAETDLTPDWAPFAAERLAAWRQNHAAYAAVHGEGAYRAQELFYSVIARLYARGGLGGVRIVAHRA